MFETKEIVSVVSNTIETIVNHGLVSTMVETKEAHYDSTRWLFRTDGTVIGKSIIKVLVGARRCGKSTLLEMLYQRFLEQGVPADNMLHIRPESSEFSSLNDGRELAGYVLSHIDKTQHVKLLLDEIQEVDGWENALRSFMVDLDADIYITGSNAHALSSDLATYITGRYVTIDVYPLSFGEFCPAYLAVNPSATERSVFSAYVEKGASRSRARWDSKALQASSIWKTCFPRFC